jgi:DNA-binding LytR/AlgR family response regulator
VATQIELTGVGNQEKLLLTPESLLYIESSGVYMSICYLKDDQIAKALLRQTFQNIEQQLIGYPQFLRCHRRYLVNLQLVKTYKGNSNGLIITLQNCLQSIPVSRQFVPVVYTRIA